MEQQIRDWLMEENTPEIRLRVLKEGLGYNDDNSEVIATKERLKSSKIYASVIKKLHSEKKWTIYDGILALAEWGITRGDMDQELDDVVSLFIEQNGFQILCGEPLLLRNLVKLGYDEEINIKDEIYRQFGKIKMDGGFGCISTNKKINDPKKEHKSCVRLTAGYLMLAAEMELHGMEIPNKDRLINYFMKRNIFYRSDHKEQPMVDVMLETFFPADPIKIGVQYTTYALKLLGCASDCEAMREGYRVLNQFRQADGRYVLHNCKSMPAFNAGKKNEPNKWITFYAYMARGGIM